MATPHPWEMAFDWNEFLTRWFEAVDGRDTGTLMRFSCVDLISERVGWTRLQRSRDGYVASLEAVWATGKFTHTWNTVIETGWDAVVEWTRSYENGTRPDAKGVSFFEIREGTGMLQLLRTYEKLGREGEALEAYERSLSIEPGKEELLERVRVLGGTADESNN